MYRNAAYFFFQPHGGIPGSMRGGHFGDGDLQRFAEMYSDKDYPLNQKLKEQVGISRNYSGFRIIHIGLIRLMKSSKVWTFERPKI